jgi:hypothetical protein
MYNGRSYMEIDYSSLYPSSIVSYNTNKKEIKYYDDLSERIRKLIAKMGSRTQLGSQKLFQKHAKELSEKRKKEINDNTTNKQEDQGIVIEI